ncbi:IS630 family transposase [Streptomyces sp. NBC_00525]|uniref:IS630 family transposase n=1 Tax=Streptomyces sp. NBC_00525 TaxID=2903660 RepID=UPI003FCD6A23
MRYPQGGGLTAERQRFREELRLKAAERFARGEASSVIARDLRVSVRSVQRWRQMWDEGGLRALRSQGPASLPRLSEKQFAQLEAELAKGPAAHGWEDQRWSLSRVKTVIGRRFHLTYTIQGVRKLLVRNGWSCQVPARRAIERGDDVVRVGQGGGVVRGRLAAARGAWLVFEGEAGFSMTPPHARTWSQRGRTPVVRVRRRVSIAALTCYKPGHRSRLIYRPRRDDGRRDGRKSFSWRDYRDLLIAAHQQLGGPIVLVWDNLNVHKAAGLREFAEARDWLTIYYLPPYAPDLNPVEGIWSLLWRGWLSNVAFHTPEHLVQTVRHGLRHIPYRSHLIDGCLTETGLTIRPA